MCRQKLTGIIGITFIILSMSIPFASGASERPACVPKAEILELIDKIPKAFPVSEKDNIYLIDKNSNGILTVTIDDLKLRIFDSRDSDPKKWGTVSNKFSANAVELDLAEIGCVVGGINNYDTSEVDASKGAIERAQKVFNWYVSLIQTQLKK